MKHLIGKQVLDLKLSPSADAFNLQHRMSQLYWSRIMPELEALFDQLSSEKELVRIDRLEIDLGHLTEDSILEGKFIDILRQQLEEQLRDILRGKGSSQVVKVHTTYGLFEQWLFFLSTGRLPWSSLQLPSGWQSDILATLGKSDGAATSLRQLLRSLPVALQRLAVQHPASFLKSLVELFTGHGQQSLLLVEEELQKLPAAYWQQAKGKNLAQASRRQIGLLFWKEILETAIVLEHRLEPRALVQRFLGSHLPITALNEIRELEKEQAYPVLLDAIGPSSRPISEKTSEGTPPPEAGPQPPQEDAPIPDETNVPSAERESPPEIKGDAPTEQEENITRQHEDEGRQEDREIPEGEPTDAGFPFENDIREAYLKDRAQLEKEEIFLRNAGVVILHPFLTSLFRKLDYLEGSNFRDETARHRAIHLAHFLATGAPESPEYSLVLPKVLCGLPLGIPLDHTLKVTAEEQKEAEALLQAVISHWTVLKNTSPDGLREGFLQRDGKLRYDAGGWRLQVENKTLDILLNQLPWGIGVIKLPWMLDMLRVEWG